MEPAPTTIDWLKRIEPWLAWLALAYLAVKAHQPLPPLPLQEAAPVVQPLRALGVHKIPTGGDVPQRIVALPEVAPMPRDRGPVYRLPPGEMVPVGLEVVRTAAGEGQDWGLAAAGVPQAWARTKGRAVRVAVLDTGADMAHPDLKEAIVATKDFTGSASGVSDVQGHGTHTAGTIAARENGVGMVGWAPECGLIVGKVLGDDGSGAGAWIAAGIDWAVGQGADVISMSLGSSAPDETIHAAIKRAAAAGVIVACAAGNDGPKEGTVDYPGGFPEVVCVAAVDKTPAAAGFSSRGKAVLVAAPGVNVVSDYPGGRLATMSGTSMATPAVAGTAALWVASHPEVTKVDRPAKFKAALQATSKDIAPAGRDTATGFGLVQPAALVGGTTPPPPPAGGVLVIDPDARTIAAPPGWKLLP
jgi:subtilisin